MISSNKLLIFFSFLLILIGCTQYEVDESIEIPVNFINTTDKELSVEIKLVDVFTNNAGHIQEKALTLLPNEEKGLLHPNYVESKEIILFVEIIENDEIIYTYASKYPGKNISFMVLDNPLRIEKEDR